MCKPEKAAAHENKNPKYKYTKSKKAASPESRMLSGIAALKDLFFFCFFLLFFSSDYAAAFQLGDIFSTLSTSAAGSSCTALTYCTSPILHPLPTAT